MRSVLCLAVLIETRVRLKSVVYLVLVVTVVRLMVGSLF